MKSFSETVYRSRFLGPEKIPARCLRGSLEIFRKFLGALLDIAEITMGGFLALIS